MWERLVAFAIVSRSYSVLNLREVLGIEDFPGDYWYEFRVKVTNYGAFCSARVSDTLEFYLQQEYKQHQHSDNFLVLPSNPSQPGYDGILIIQQPVVTFPRQYFYLQMKVQSPSAAAWPTVLGNMVSNNLHHFLASPQAGPASQTTDLPDMSSLHNVVYVWDKAEGLEEAFSRAVDEYGTVEQRSRREALQRSVAQAALDSAKSILRGASDEQQQRFDRHVQEYLSSHWHNIHVVSEKVLRNWLNPSLLAFPVMFTEIGESNDEEGLSSTSN